MLNTGPGTDLVSNFGGGTTPAAPAGGGGMMALSLGMSLFSALNSYMAGQQEKKVYNYKAQVARAKAQLAIQQGEEIGRRYDLQGRDVMGKVVSGFAAAGVNPNEGSPMEIEARVAHEAAINVATAHHNARVEAASLESEAQWDEYAGKVALRSGVQRAGMTMMQAGPKAYVLDKYVNSDLYDNRSGFKLG